MEKRTLGKTELQVSVLGFGASEIGHTPIESSSLKHLLDSALEAGVNVIDTAECYHGSEEAVGQALIGRRDQFYIVTKCGHNRGLEAMPNWTPHLLEQTIDRSLQRLRTDHVDILLLHSCSADILRQGDVIDVVERARKAGKARFIGYSGDSQPALVAVQTGRFDVLETSVNIADQECIDLTLPLAQEKGMGVIAKRPLANVAWANISAPEGVVYWPEGYIDLYTKRLKELDYTFLHGDIQHAVSIALRFTVGCAGVSTAIIGTRNPERLRQNAAYVQEGPLDQDVINAIRTRWRAMAMPEWVGTN